MSDINLDGLEGILTFMWGAASLFVALMVTFVIQSLATGNRALYGPRVANELLP